MPHQPCDTDHSRLTQRTRTPSHRQYFGDIDVVVCGDAVSDIEDVGAAVRTSKESDTVLFHC